MTENNISVKGVLGLLLCLLLANPTPAVARDFYLDEGTEIYLRLHISVDTKISQTGDRIVATVEEPVLLDNIEVIPVGARVLGRVGEIKKPGRFGRGGRLVLTFETIEVPGAGTIKISGSLLDIYDPDAFDIEDDKSLKHMDIGTEGEVKADGPRKATRLTSVVAGGAGGAALAGGALGAVLGVAIGTGVAFIWFKGKQVKLPAGMGLVMRIDRGITVSVPDLPRQDEQRQVAEESLPSN